MRAAGFEPTASSLEGSRTRAQPSTTVIASELHPPILVNRAGLEPATSGLKGRARDALHYGSHMEQTASLELAASTLAASRSTN